MSCLGGSGASTCMPCALLSQSHQPWEPCKAQISSVLSMRLAGKKRGECQEKMGKQNNALHLL